MQGVQLSGRGVGGLAVLVIPALAPEQIVAAGIRPHPSRPRAVRLVSRLAREGIVAKSAACHVARGPADREGEARWRCSTTIGREADELSGSDVATRALSVTVVEKDFVEAVYEKMASVYDFTFGPTLHAGRLQAIQRMAIKPGDRILEVGVGTGINLTLYPRRLQRHRHGLVGFDAGEGAGAGRRKGLRNVRLLQMDASALTFPDESFDIVYAPYLVSVVPDPVKVALEMHRVCRPGGRVIILNHFLSSNPLVSWVERSMSPPTVHIGFKSDLDLPAFLAQAELHPDSIEKVNIPPIWSLVTCIKDSEPSRCIGCDRGLACRARRTCRAPRATAAPWPPAPVAPVAPRIVSRLHGKLPAMASTGLLRNRVGIGVIVGLTTGLLAIAAGRIERGGAQAAPPQATPDVVTLDVSRPGPQISPTMFGVFFEDINFAADGGLYPELVKNRSFEFTEPLYWWRRVWREGADGELTIRTDGPLNAQNPHYLRLRVYKPAGVYGLVNSGFRGMRRPLERRIRAFSVCACASCAALRSCRRG